MSPLSTNVMCLENLDTSFLASAFSLARHVSDNCPSRVCKGAVFLHALTHELCHTACIICKNIYT